jgi:ABC-type molybdate transport system substrate-binding protein
MLLLSWLATAGTFDGGRETLLVYCAAGVRPAVEPIAEEYETQYGISVEIQSSPSGALESQIKLARKGDLFIPAAEDPFLVRGRNDGWVHEIIPLAKFRLVLAVRPGWDKHTLSMQDVVEGRVKFALANEPAAVGLATRLALEKHGLWDQVKAGARVFMPTVTEVAATVKEGVNVDAGFVWDTTARQYGLTIVELPELESSESLISVGVLDTASHPAAALRLARFLAAPETGQPIFREHHYNTVDNDAWAETPEITLFSGTLNRGAIVDTLEAFQQREGARIKTVYEGCGALVATMKSGTLPDAYFACDVSYVADVHDHFAEPMVISQSDIVLLVRPGNPRGIAGLDDLAQPDLAIGIADPELTALGTLTVRLFESAGVHDAVMKNRPITVTTAPLLVTQLTTSDKLDVAVVYRANCAGVGEQAEIVSVEHPAAHATQPFSIAHSGRYPRLVARLRDALVTETSRARFEAQGFRWLRD